MDKPIIRWTIGPVKPSGFDFLKRSVRAFQRLYPACDFYICHNNITDIQRSEITDIGATLINQLEITDIGATPIGVAWKLYPSRINSSRHEIFVDNDLVVEQRLDEIDHFLQSDSTMLLEETSRHYGRFERHVPAGYRINSGLFGVPPNFSLQKYIDFHGNHWEENCEHSSKTWDEQGLVAYALLSYKKFTIISNTTVTNCEKEYRPSKGMHFVGLNRREHHRPYTQYVHKSTKMYL